MMASALRPDWSASLRSASRPTFSLPAPGVYARHNAVDVPALLPDGSPAPTSVSQTLRSRGDIITNAGFALEAIEEQED